MGRKVIDKVFDIVVRMDVTVRVHADSKEEASAWINERLINGLTIEDTSSEFIPLEVMPKIENVLVKKVKRPRRIKLTPTVAIQEPTGE
jgi:hypothetical protein